MDVGGVDDVYCTGDIRFCYDGPLSSMTRLVTLVGRRSAPAGTTGIWWVVTDTTTGLNSFCAQAHLGGRKISEMEAVAWLAR